MKVKTATPFLILLAQKKVVAEFQRHSNDAHEIFWFLAAFRNGA
jgi:hypothetical protein